MYIVDNSDGTVRKYDCTRTQNDYTKSRNDYTKPLIFCIGIPRLYVADLWLCIFVPRPCMVVPRLCIVVLWLAELFRAPV